jgi:hypothetical protein
MKDKPFGAAGKEGQHLNYKRGAKLSSRKSPEDVPRSEGILTCHARAGWMKYPGELFSMLTKIPV